MDNEVVDLFEEEIKKRDLKEDKKIAKKLAKEAKKSRREEKRLEKLEDIEFAKKLEERDGKKEEPVVKTRSESHKTKKHPVLNFFLGFSIVSLLIIGSDYAIFNIIKQKDIEVILTSSALCLTSIFYLLSILVKNIRIKKILQIISLLAFTAYMAYFLFLA